jgi:DNA primase
MGENAQFAPLVEQLRASGSDFDPVISEIAEQTETDVQVVAIELAGALRQMRLQVLKHEMEQLVATGLRDALAVTRYREIMQLQEQLRKDAIAETNLRT